LIQAKDRFKIEDNLEAINMRAESISEIMAGLELAIIALLLMIIMGDETKPDPQRAEVVRQQVLSFCGATS